MSTSKLPKLRGRFCKKGNCHAKRRWVECSDTCVIENKVLEDRIIAALESGKRVKLFGQIEINPFVDTDMKTVKVRARLLEHTRLRDCLRGAEVEWFDKNGEAVPQTRIKEFVDDLGELRERFRDGYAFGAAGLKFDSVTPDLMTTCPQCGHFFRVGKKLS